MAVLAGRYRLDRRLGHGAMGEVWGGHDVRLSRDVAVKLLRDAHPDEVGVRRFVLEAKLPAGLLHPGITVVFDAGSDDGQLFIVTELLHGEDLREVLAGHPGGLPLERVLDFGIQLADALAFAHGRGIIHRDLKPANLFVQADGHLPGGRLKVCDFGLARDLTMSLGVTSSGERIGTPLYMAPEQEQWDAAAAGPGVDLYAVGCILYEMMTGRLPFEGPSLSALIEQRRTQPPVPPCDLKPGIPAALNELVLSLLSKDAADRPASAAEVLDTLTRIRDAPRQATASASGPPEDPVPYRSIRTLTGHTGAVYGVAFSPDGALLASVGADRTVRLWDTATDQTIRTLTGHTGAVYGVAFSPDGALLASVGADRTVRLWDVATGQAIRPITSPRVSAVAFSPDGALLATGGADGRARLWDVATGEAIRTLTGHTDSVSAVAFSPDGALLATGSGDRTARLWDTATGEAMHTLTGHTEWVNAVAFSPDGALLATGSGDRTARLWDTATGQAMRTLTGQRVSAVAFSPDGALLATGSGPDRTDRVRWGDAAGGDNTVRLWGVATGQGIRTFNGRSVSAVAFSPDGALLATGSGDGTARLWALG